MSLQAITESVPSASASEDKPFDPKAMLDMLGEFNPLESVEPAKQEDEFKEDQKEIKDQSSDLKDEAKNKVETKAEEPKPEVKDTSKDELADKFVRLSREEARMRAEKQAMKVEAQELAELKRFRQELADDPARAIARLGVSPDSVFAEHAKEEALKPSREFESFKEEIKRELQELKVSQYKNDMIRKGEIWDAQFSKDIESPDYKLVKLWDPEGQMVRDLVLQHHQETGEILTPSQALGTIKAALEPRARALVDSGVFAATGDAAKAQPGAKAQLKKTITTDVDDFASKRAPYLDDDDDMERLINKFNAHR